MRVSARALVFGSVGMILATATAAFAQDPNAYPPQQYPQQQYPQQQYPQQQYPQQQYPQQYPPAGYAAPAPAAPPSYQQPGYAPPPAPAYSDLRHGGLVIVYMGASIPMGEGSGSMGTGLSLGGIFGGHLSPSLSLNGEFSFSTLNYNNMPSGASAGLGAFAFSPFYHFGEGLWEMAVGPKLGYFASIYDTGETNTTYEKITVSGFAYGLNAAFFYRVSNTMAVGGLLNYTGHNASEVCATSYGVEECGDVDSSGNDAKLLTLNAGLRW